jgi:hypothetical protein
MSFLKLNLALKTTTTDAKSATDAIDATKRAAEELAATQRDKPIGGSGGPFVSLKAGASGSSSLRTSSGAQDSGYEIPPELQALLDADPKALEWASTYQNILKVLANPLASPWQIADASRGKDNLAYYFGLLFPKLGDIEKLAKELTEYQREDQHSGSVSPTKSGNGSTGTLGAKKSTGSCGGSIQAPSLSITRWQGGLR